MDIKGDHTEFLKQKDPQLVSAYKASLQRAKELRVQTVGFSLLCAGVFRGERSLHDILQIGLQTVLQNCYEGLREVTMVAWTKEEQDLLMEIASKMFPTS